MVSAQAWRVVSEQEAAAHWEGWLEKFDDGHIRQSLAWARYKSGGWTPLFTGLFDGAAPLALGLCLVKSAPLRAATLLWINGGPVFRKHGAQTQDLAALGGYLKGLKDHLRGLPGPILRINAQIPMDVEAQFLLRQENFRRPLMPLGTGLTYVIDLTQSLEALRDNLEKKWRHQLKQSEKAAPEVSMGRDRALLERYLPLHNALCRRKNLPTLELTLEELERMAELLGENVTFLVLSSQGRDGCGAALWSLGDKAWLAMSSADERGLELNLPNALYWEILKLLKEKGVARFDLAGVDPGGNWGVFNFKRGLNAAAVELLGEWEWSPSDWRRRAFNAALWLRRDSLA